MAGECALSAIQPKRMDIAMSDYGYWAETGEEVTEDELHDAYDNYLGDIDGDVNVAGMTFGASDVVKELDPIAYRVGLSDFHNFMIEDGEIIEELEDEED